MELCNHNFELANGETLVCSLDENHKGDCKGYFMGTPAIFPKKFNSEYEIFINNKRIENDSTIS